MDFLERIKGEFGPSAQDDQQLLQLIEQAAENRATTLDLSGRRLKRVPTEIGKVTSLIELDLSGNRLTTLPSEIGQLINLIELDLSDNQLSELALEIGPLINLRSLKLANNQLKTLPPQILQLTNLKYLDLSGNQLETLPPEIEQLSKLTELYLHKNELKTLPPQLGQLNHLAELKLWRNKLKVLPPEIGLLSRLTRLSISFNQLRTLPSEIGQLTNLIELNVRKNKLETLPSQIGQLTKLTTFLLSSNKLSTLPPEIGQLSHLIELDIRLNQLSTLPAEIGRLTSLPEFNVRSNKLSTLPAEVGQLTNLTVLDLSNNRFRVLPIEIGQLTDLRSLHIGGNPLDALPSEIWQLSNLTSLSLHTSQLERLPSEIAQLTNLMALYLYDNQLVTLPSEIGQLINLSIFDLHRNQLSILPPEIGQLRRLNKLDLRRNKLESLPPEMAQLTKLTTLDLGENQLHTLLAEVGQLTSLARLYLYDNKLSSLPPEIGQLTNLTTLELHKNILKRLPSEIGQLTKLTKIELRRNELSTLPSEIGQLTKLTELDLRWNQLSSLPAEMAQLSKLTKLELGRNQLDALPTAVYHLSSLTRLDLRQNRLRTLPEEIWQLLNRMSELDLRDNPLPIPPEILNYTNEPDTVIEYYLKAGTRLNEAKLVLVGQGGVGKTSLVKRLIEGTFDKQEPITEGVNIKQWAVTVNPAEGEASSDEHIRLNIWDFGGQEIMHATHQFFLTTRTLYLLVLDARQGAIGSRLDYWLQLIQSFGANSPIIVVINKIDEYQRTLNQRELCAKYPTIKAFVNTSCESGEGIAELEWQIRAVVDSLTHVRDLIPVEWLNIRTQLQRMDRNYIAYREYVQVCEAQQISKEPEQRLLIRLLHDLGVVLNFEDDPQLRKTIILSPEWITGAVYQIINARALHNKGVLEIRQLSDILQPYVYPKETYLLIVEIMRRFERCFDLEGYVGQKFLLPDLLPTEEPPLGVWPTDRLDFEYRYNFLPVSVISRFMVQMHGFILGNHYSRTGVALVKDKNKALVKAFPQEKKISISIIGEAKGRRQFLTDIRSRFEQIHHAISNLQATEHVGYEGEMIPCVLLHNLHKQGLPYYPVPTNHGEVVMVNVQEVLNRVKRESSQQEDSKIQRLLEQLKQELHPQLFYASALSLGKQHYKVGAYSLARQALAVTHQAIQAWRGIDRKDEGYVNLRKESAELYDMLVHCCVEENNHLKGFEYAAVAKGHTFINQLAEAKFDLKFLDDQEEFADKLKQARQLRDEIEKSRNATSAEALSDRRSQLYKLLQEENELWQEMARDYPLLTATFTAPTLLSKQASNLANTLQATLVEYYHHGGGWGAFVVTAHDIRYISLPALNNDLLTRFVQSPNQVHLPAGGPSKGDKRLAELYEAVMAPLKLTGQRVIMAPFEGLYLLPLSAAYQQSTNHDLMPEHVFSLVPSLTMLHVLKQEQKRRSLSKETIRKLLSVAYPGSQKNLLSIFI